MNRLLKCIISSVYLIGYKWKVICGSQINKNWLVGWLVNLFVFGYVTMVFEIIVLKINQRQILVLP